MPTPRATWLVEPHSVESDLSRPMSFSQAPPLRVRCRSAASCAVRSTCVEGSFTSPTLRRSSLGLASQTCENQAPTRECGLGINEHERDAFCRVVSRLACAFPGVAW